MLADLDRLDKLAEALANVFFALIVFAILSAILGSPGTGFLLLALGGCAHIGRAGIEDFVRAQREAAARPRPQISISRTRRQAARAARPTARSASGR